MYTFGRSLVGKLVGNQNKKLESGHCAFRNCYTVHRVLFERSNNTGSFAGHLKFQEKSAFTHSLWVNNDKLQ